MNEDKQVAVSMVVMGFLVFILIIVNLNSNEIIKIRKTLENTQSISPNQTRINNLALQIVLKQMKAEKENK